MTDALLEAGRGKFIVGMTDWHPGGDAVAACRDPQRLAVDMLEHVDAIKRLLVRLADDYYASTTSSMRSCAPQASPSHRGPP